MLYKVLCAVLIFRYSISRDAITVQSSGEMFHSSLRANNFDLTVSWKSVMCSSRGDPGAETAEVQTKDIYYSKSGNWSTGEGRSQEVQEILEKKHKLSKRVLGGGGKGGTGTKQEKTN